MKDYKYKIDLKRIVLQITLYKYLFKYTPQTHTHAQYKTDRERDNEHKIFTW